MASKPLIIHNLPRLTNARMIMGFSGWMDGGEVSTGALDYLIETSDATCIATIDPSPFYIYNVPGSMEVANLFRPHVQIEDGRITTWEEPQNTFYADTNNNLVLLKAKEPNIAWRDYAECIFEIINRFNVEMTIFIGSVAGLVPHTRDPRIFSGISDDNLRPLFHKHALIPSNYEGPASFITYLMTLAHDRAHPLVSLVTEVPAYVEGRNIRCLTAALRKISAILELNLDLADLRALITEFDARITDSIHLRPELEEQIRQIEEDYDRQAAPPNNDDALRAWLEKQGIRLD